MGSLLLPPVMCLLLSSIICGRCYRKWNGSHCLFGFDQYSTDGPWSRGKFQPLISKKKWTLSLEFRSSVNFSSQEAALSYQKPVKYFYGFSSRRGHFLRLQKSHRKKLINNVEDAANFFYFHRKFEVNANENETSRVPGSFISTQSKTKQPVSRD